MNDVILDKLISKSKCRFEQFKLLLSFLNQEDPLPPSLFITGPPQSGKTHVVTNLVRDLHFNHAYLDCRTLQDSGSWESLFCAILDAVRLSPSVKKSKELDEKVDCPGEWVRLLKVRLSNFSFSSEGFILILDSFDVLRNMPCPEVIFSVLFRLQEFLELNVCVVAISHLALERFTGGRAFPLPLCLMFPQYTHEELLTILVSHVPPKDDPFYSEQFYANYIRIVLSVFYNASRDLQELFFMAQMHYHEFCEPLRSGGATAIDLGKLWRHIEPKLKESLKSIYLRIRPLEADEIGGPRSTLDVSQGMLIRGLSRDAKFLLVAAFLASFNPPSTDKKFFVKLSSKRKKSVLSTRKDRSTHLLTGPRSFSLSRLLAIYGAISEDVAESWESFLLTHVSSLCSLGLLHQDNEGDVISKPLYTCLLNIETALALAHSLNFPLEGFLSDFCV